jgi:hypothetical protein
MKWWHACLITRIAARWSYKLVRGKPGRDGSDQFLLLTAVADVIDPRLSRSLVRLVACLAHAFCERDVEFHLR